MIGMKKTASIGLIISVCLLLLATTTTEVQAKAEKVILTFDAEEVARYPGDRFRQWVSEDGISHVRGVIIVQECSDDLGTLTFVGNANIDPATGDGTTFGTWTWVVDSDVISGTAEGSYSGKYTGWLVSAKGIGFGTEGDLVGVKIDCSNQQVGDIEFEYTALLLNPHG